MNYSLEEEIIERFFEKIKSLIMPSESNNYKSRFLQSSILLYCVVLLLALKIGAIFISINIPQNIFFADITKSALENFVNQTRQSLGLQTLSNNAKLDQAAQLKAEDMVQDNYFNHTSPSGITPWAWFLQAGYKYKYAGENLAIGFFDSQEVYSAWLNSPSHKANIVNPNYIEVGTAVLTGFGQGNTVVVVQEFGSQLPAKQTIVQSKTNSAVKTNQPTQTTNTQTNTQTQTTNTQTTNTQTTDTQTQTTPSEQVLSQTTGVQNSIVPAAGSGKSSLPSKVLNSVMYNYDGILQNIIYGVSLVVMGILLTLIFFNFNISFKKQFVFRAVLIIALLSVATLLNKETIIALIPHQILI